MDCPSPSRRAFLQLGGIGIASLAGCASHTNDDDAPSDDETSSDNDIDDEQIEKSDSRDIPENGAVVFIYDDGPM